MPKYDQALAQRLIIAADYKPPASMTSFWAIQPWMYTRVLRLAGDLKDLNIILKMNTAARICGYGLGEQIRRYGMSVFYDLKFCDISETLANDGAALYTTKPRIVTAMCNAGVKALVALKAALPDTEVLGVGMLTTQTDKDAQAMYGCDYDGAQVRLARIAQEAGLDGLITSARKIEVLRSCDIRLPFTTPAIRPRFSLVKNDDQNQALVVTPAEAIRMGAHRIVVGRPVTGAEDPRAAAEQTLEEMSAAGPFI